MKTTKCTCWMQIALGLLGVVAAAGSTGCQVTEGGQTLPSPYYIEDDVQYFPPGPEYLLSREQEVQERFRLDAEAQRAR